MTTKVNPKKSPKRSLHVEQNDAMAQDQQNVTRVNKVN